MSTVPVTVRRAIFSQAFFSVDDVACSIVASHLGHNNGISVANLCKLQRVQNMYNTATLQTEELDQFFAVASVTP